VSPEVVRIQAAGNVPWQNTAEDAWALVVFPASIAASFRCKDLRPYFTRSEDVYRSQPLTNPETERVQLPCALTPGSYDYEIWLMGVGFGGVPLRRATQHPSREGRRRMDLPAPKSVPAIPG